MQTHSISPREMGASLWRNRDLIGALVRREVVGRYRGSFMGILWSFFNPALMLVVYTFVFSVIFKARWSSDNDSRTEFALILFAGMITFNLFSECVNRAPTQILANVNYVKKVVFPLEILPVVALGAAFFHFLISLAVWVIFYVVFFGLPHPTILLMPAILMPLALLTLGFTWLLASLGVYLRDVSQIVGVLTTALLFLTPIFYPISALPEQYRLLLSFNPLTPIIEQSRMVLVWGSIPDLGFWLGQLSCSAVVAWLGFAWFQKTRKGFADVL